MYTASDLRKGLKLKFNQEPYEVIDFNFLKPGKGKSLYKCKLRNMITGSQFERTFREIDRFEPANLQETKMQFLYKKNTNFFFMNLENYEEIFLLDNYIGNAKNFLVENIKVIILFFNNLPIDLILPTFIEIKVIKSTAWLKGDSFTAGKYKYVILETGFKILVPSFIKEGQKIKVDTRYGKYLTKVK